MKHVKELAAKLFETLLEQCQEIHSLEHGIADRDAFIKDIEARYEDHKQALLISDDLTRRLQESNNALAAENNKRQEIEQMLNASLDKLAQQNTELTNRFQALQQGSVDLSNKVAELETENAVLADRAAVLQLQNNDLRDEIKAHVITRDNLCDRIDSARGVLLANRNDINQTWVDDVDVILSPVKLISK